MKKTLLFIIGLILISSPAFATTYYASPSGGGAASCVDNTTNVCSLQRAITVASTGTNIIELADGSYSASSFNFTSTNTGCDLTLRAATGATPILSSSSGGAVDVIDIAATMVSGTITFDGITISDSDSDYSINNKSPEVNIVFKNGFITNTDASAGYAFYYPVDTTNKISLDSGEDTTTNLRTGATTNLKMAQKIVVGGSNITVNRAAFKLRRRCGNKGTNCDEFISGESWDYRNKDTLTVTIETDSAGAPSGTPVTNGTSQTILASSVPWRAASGGEWSSFSFSSNVSLSSGTTYWVVITGSYTTSSTNYIEVSTDTGNGYASGDSATYNGTSWTGASAGTDLLFAIDRAHTRNLTVTNNTVSTSSTTIVLAWADTVDIENNTLTSTGASILTLTLNGQYTVSDDQYKKVVLADNIVSSTTSGSRLIGVGITNYAKTYTNVLVVKGNTGTVDLITAPSLFVRKFLFSNNSLTIQATGTGIFQLGKEVDGADPQEFNYEPFDQIIIEGNVFNYSGNTHNHLMLFAIGSSNGVFRNNTIYAHNAGSGGRAWGIVVKSIGWLIEGNKIYGCSPAIAVYGTNHTSVVYNTLECFGSATDGCLLVRNHQDSIYGPTTYGKGFFNYIKDNIVISDDSTFSALDYGTTTADAYDPTHRDPKYWSNIIDNNTYYSKIYSHFIDFETPSTQAYLTSGDGVSALQSTWASSSYTDKSSLSIYNDLGNSSFSLPAIKSPSTGDFTTSGSSVINKGTLSGTNIGADQVSGSGGGNLKMGLSL